MRIILLFFIFTFGLTSISNGQNDTYAKATVFTLAPPIIESASIFFDKKNKVILSLGLKNTNIHYTLDGTTPTELSPVFSKQIIIDQSSILKAKAFHPQCLPSQTVSAQFVKLKKTLPIKNITINQTPHENYPGTGAKGLVDRKKGTTNFRTSHWMGFAGGDLETIIELEKKTNFQKVTTSLLSDQGSWIFMPEAIEVYCSKDGKDFKLLATKKIKPTEEGESIGLHFEEVVFPKDKAKFIKVIVKNISSIPVWHPGKGTAPWLFIDEIIIE
ncbi:MAG: chitobiase/beta-hexosaminidase C-terminal domain-containing protein [Saprospiraceae bacterium]